MNQENILRILNEIEITISKIKNELEPKEKYEELINKIKSIDDLEYLFNGNNECKEHIFKCIKKVTQYPFLNEYIDLYFKFNPDKVNEQDRYRNTALIFSLKYEHKGTFPLKYGNIETSKIILKHSPNLELKDEYDNTALFYACSIKNTNDLNNMIKLLLDMGADYNVINNLNQTPLFNLCVNNNATIDTYKMFFDKGIDINHRNKYNNTALNFLSCYPNEPKQNRSEIIDLFKQYGYNFTIHDIDYILKNNQYAHLNINSFCYDKYTFLQQILSYYDNLDLISNVKLVEFDNKPVKLIKVLYYFYCNDLYCMKKIDEEIIKLAISKGAKKEDLIDDKLAKFF